MPTRRVFIKQSFGAVSVSLILPKSLLGAVRPAAASDPQRRVLVVCQFAGGNDGLNTVVPFTDTNYQNLRPTLAFKQNQLVDATGRSTVISDTVGLHPSLTKFKDLYDQGRVAIVREVGYANQSDSHFTSMDIWGAANPEGLGAGKGWLAKYADQALAAVEGLSVVTLTPSRPKTLTTDTVVVTSFTPANISNFGLKTDPQFPPDRSRDLQMLNANNSRSFPDGSSLSAISRSGAAALLESDEVQQAVKGYTPAVTYPVSDLAAGLKLIAALISLVPEVDILYISLGGFDTHVNQAAQHATLLTQFSEGVAAFYGDLAAHGLADNVLMMEWSEFGRRVAENGNKGCDHGGGSSIFVFGNPVKGGIYGDGPDLAASALDHTGNNVFKIDFRSVYATILKNWLSVDPRAILGRDFEDLGFLG
jgi:uncharacterized protein (DUF1501 family)